MSDRLRIVADRALCVRATIILAALCVPQFAARGQDFEISSTVTLDEADGVVRGQLERVKVLIANRRWDETVETLRQVADQRGDKVVAVSPGYYVRIRDYCHRRLASLPAEALALYRGQVDAQAKTWFEQGVDGRDEQPLRSIVDQLYCSTYGDDALWLLGEFALEKGDYGSARAYWEQLVETPPATVENDAVAELRADQSLPKDDLALFDRFYQPRESRGNYEFVGRRTIDPEAWRLAATLRMRGIVGPRLTYPAADQSPADVVARLILVSIMEGSSAWAEAGLGEYAEIFPDARGRLGGREANYVEALTALSAESRDWPRARPSRDWPTFAGNTARNRTADGPFDVGRVKWRAKLKPVRFGDAGSPSRRIAEDRQVALSYHPIVVDDVVFVNDSSSISAYDLHTGRPAWGGQQAMLWRPDDVVIDRSFGTRIIGVARHTMTAHGNRLFARMGNAVTSSPTETAGHTAGGYIVCLDLKTQGSLLWTAEPPEDRWAFEGTPVADDEHVYTAMRKGGVRPQVHMACLDADNGKLLWRRLVCSAESPGQGMNDEITHVLPTLVGDQLFLNTNLGAVAALSKTDGETRWVALYPRAAGRDLNRRSTHFYRDLTPCVYDRGMLYVAPSDSRHILAFDAACGLLQWETTLAADAVHLLGVRNDQLFACGDGFWRIHALTGKVLQGWTDPSIKGYGRGIVVDDRILWPTREDLLVFSADDADYSHAIKLSTRDAGGGNLVWAGQNLLIAAGQELTVLDRYGGLPADEPPASEVPPADAPPEEPPAIPDASAIPRGIRIRIE